MKGSRKEIHQKYLLKNNKIIATEGFDPHEITKTTSIYEVIRIIDGIPLFLEEHLERLNRSIMLLDFGHKIDLQHIGEQVHHLIEVNQCYNYNMKLIVNGLEESSPDLYLFFIESNYPSEEQYINGVKTILYHAERENPNAKVILKDFRQQVDEAIKESKAFEAILVDQHQHITEGSRSNIFVVKDDTVYTAPANKVLMGVTRNRIIDLCKSLEIPIEESPISVDFLKSADALFMTGTSPKVLPITIVDEMHYASTTHPIILKIRKAYDDLIKAYIANKRP